MKPEQAFPALRPIYQRGKTTDPLDIEIAGYTATEGMSLRDYFAAKALQGILAANMIGKEVEDKDIERVMALASYRMAEAMLDARSRD